MTREPGYYWVRQSNGEWMVAQWYGDGDTAWAIMGTEIEGIDSDWTKIGPRIAEPAK
jgi:hypothetical protein